MRFVPPDGVHAEWRAFRLAAAPCGAFVRLLFTVWSPEVASLPSRLLLLLALGGWLHGVARLRSLCPRSAADGW
jgi:hypothetical protein